MIELQNVSIHFNKQVQVLNQANYIFHSGVFYALTGSSEAARNAIFSLMTGLIPSEMGRIIVYGVNLKKVSSEAILRKDIGFHNQNNKHIDYLTVLKNIEIAIDISLPHIKEKKNIIKEVLDRIGFEETLLEKKVMDLNPYYRFLLDVALLILCKKKIFLVNDPTKAFSPKEISLFERQLKRLSQDERICVILSTESKEIAKLAERIAVLKNGKVI